MSEDISVYGVSAALHHRTCMLHDNGRISLCSGTLKSGRNCVNKATGPQVPGMMSTCKIHREQLKISGWCQETLPCGFKCGHLFEWKPHGFHLCPSHRKYMMTCYFLKIPMELRLRIYRFLLPDRPIPARYGSAGNLTTDGEGMHTAILRVNHQIHDEATSLLYGARAFTIDILGHQLIMCNSPRLSVQPGVLGRNNHALMDYQLQLMLLEQQNKKRLRMAQGQDDINGEQISICTSATCSVQLPTRSPIPDACMPIEPVWHPPLSERYFDMIRSFRIEFTFPFSARPIAIHHAHGSSNTNAANDKALESKLYDYCDSLHKVIGRLRLMQRPILRIEIFIYFQNTYIQQEDAFSAAQLLLQPFRRLRNVTTLEIPSVTMRNSQGREIELVAPGLYSCAANMTFVDYLERWSRDQSRLQPTPEYLQVFEAYWRLEKLLRSIREHHHCLDPKFFRFTELLHAARVAREANDLTSFRGIWDEVVSIWFDYLSSQKEFQSNVTCSIDAIHDIVGKGSQTSSRPYTKFYEEESHGSGTSGLCTKFNEESHGSQASGPCTNFDGEESDGI